LTNTYFFPTLVIDCFLFVSQAFAAAQLNGDWTKLESEMSAVLGPEAVGLSGSGGIQAPDVLAQASQLIQNFVGTSPGSGADKVDLPPGMKSFFSYKNQNNV
jgi:hypothetical protein